MADAVVVGGGVAGLSVAAALAGQRDVVLLEREALLAAHASGHNAAIYRPLEDDTTSAPLARRSLQLLDDLGVRDVLARTGVLLASAEPEQVERLGAHARAQQVAAEVLSRDALHELAPALRGGPVRAALLLRDGGVLDIHRVTSGLAQAAKRRGATLRVSAEVARIRLSRAGVSHVELTSGEIIAARDVVLCAGAWAAKLGAGAGSTLALVPYRRHLVHLRGAPGAPAPVVWRLDDEVYFRPESGGVLASPCDAEVWSAQAPPADPSALALLARKLAQCAPELVGLSVQRSWACLRTFAPDREVVVGPDPRIDGLHWLCGLGGRGMSVAPAAGELLAQRLVARAR